MKKLLPLIAAIAWSCSGDFTLEPGVIISCVDNSGCPSAFVCNTTAQRCVERGRNDIDPPTLQALAPAQPPQVRMGAPVRIHVGSSEVLAEAPTVSLSREGVDVPLTLVTPFTSTSTAFEFTYVPTAEDSEGEHPLSFKAIDVVGNDGAGSIGASLRFDFTPPEVLREFATLRIDPDRQTNPISDPTAAAPSSDVNLTFVTSEPVGGDPIVSTTLPSGVVINKRAGAGVSFVYQVDWVASTQITDGTYDLQVKLRDRAGNESTTILSDSPLVVDTTPPPPPDFRTAGAITLYRVPWGSATTEGATLGTLQGLAGSVEPNSIVLVIDPPSSAQVDFVLSGEIVRGVADANGAFGGAPGDPNALTMAVIDRPTVHILSVDAAGNISDANPMVEGVQVGQIESVVMVATALEDRGGNPTTLSARASWAPTLQQGGSDTIDHLLTRLDRALSQPPVRAGAASWRLHGPQRTFAHARRIEGAYDPVRGRFVLFGDIVGTDEPCTFCPATWQLAGRHWTDATPADPEGDGNPGGRELHAMAYDVARGVTLLFSGGRVPSDDLWAFDGFSWARIRPTDFEMNGFPAPRFRHAMAYDPRNRSVLVYGGCAQSAANDACSERLGDIWSYNGATWRNLCGTPGCQATAPAARYGAEMVYDEARRTMLIVGGVHSNGKVACVSPDVQTVDGCITNEIWSWSGMAWQKLCNGSCAATAPPPRTQTQLAYDPLRERVVMFGGCDQIAGFDSIACIGRLSDTWEFNGVTWISPSISDPELDRDPPGYIDESAAMDFDAVRGQVVLVTTRAGDTTTWGYDGSSWKKISPASAAPIARCGARAQYDSVRQQVVMFGGCADDCDGGSDGAGCANPLDDTWTWTPDGWRQVSPATTPPPRGHHGLAFDRTRGRVAMTGGFDASGTRLGDMWEWNGTDWAEVGTMPVPAPIASHALTWDGEALLSAGGNYRTGAPFTLRHNGQRFVDPCDNNGCTAVPGASEEGSAVYDPIRNQVIAFGGFGSAPRSTWRWMANDWAELLPNNDPTQPVFRRRMGMTFDSAREKVTLHGGWVVPEVLLGGQTVTCAPGSAFCEDLWQFDGTQWRLLEVSDPEGDGNPAARGHHVFAHHESTGESLSFGGATSTRRVTDEAWVFDGGATTRPAHVFELPLSQARVNDGVNIRTISVRWCGSASSVRPGTATPVAEMTLSVWRVRAWVPLTTTAAQVTGLGSCIEWTSTADFAQDVLNQLQSGANRTMTFAATPAHPNGTSTNMATVSTAYVEVTVSYISPPPGAMMMP